MGIAMKKSCLELDKSAEVSQQFCIVNSPLVRSKAHQPWFGFTQLSDPPL